MDQTTLLILILVLILLYYTYNYYIVEKMHSGYIYPLTESVNDSGADLRFAQQFSSTDQGN